jgi:hypothetical protein
MEEYVFRRSAFSGSFRRLGNRAITPHGNQLAVVAGFGFSLLGVCFLRFRCKKSA